MLAPGSRMRARHWVYLDDARTHEVHAQVEPRAEDILLAMTEFPAGSRDPTEAMTDERRLASESQLQAAIVDLEARLAVSGQYYRADVSDLVADRTWPAGHVGVEDMRWAPLQAPAGARKVDLRAFEVPLPGATTPAAKLGFHHFHAPKRTRDSLLITLPRADLETPRSILAQLDFDFPDVAGGDLKLLHPRLAPGTLRSRLVKEHIELPTRGYAKLHSPQDYERAFGAGWVERAKQVFRGAAARVFDLRREAAPPVASDFFHIDAERLARAAATERARALRARFLADEDAERLFETGELAIRRFVQARRRRADHHVVYELSVLQSLLLVEYGLRKREQALLNEEGAKLLRYALPGERAGVS